MRKCEKNYKLHPFLAQVVMPEENEETSQIVENPTASVDKTTLMTEVTLSRNQKYDLIFQKESNLEIARRREAARKPYKSLESTVLEKTSEDFFPKSCDFPQRPEWKQTMSKSEIEASEAKYFREYVNTVMDIHKDQLSYFELNLETWRQLWRVVEMSDILLLIVDARYPPAMMPPSLVSKVAPKPVILVLNKVLIISKVFS